MRITQLKDRGKTGISGRILQRIAQEDNRVYFITRDLGAELPYASQMTGQGTMYL